MGRTDPAIALAQAPAFALISLLAAALRPCKRSSRLQNLPATGALKPVATSAVNHIR